MRSSTWAVRGICLAIAASLSPGGVSADPPDPPVVVAPADGATTVAAGTDLVVSVTDPDGDNMSVTFFGRRTDGPVPDFTIVDLPDTQTYAQLGSTVFRDQTEWIVANRQSMNVVYVAHVGDVIDDPDLDSEWLLADDALGVLEDPVTTMLADGIPYGVAVGNHDQTGGAGTFGDEGATTVKFNQYFGLGRFQARSYFGGHFGINNDNHYDLFSTGGMDFVVVYLEYDPLDHQLRQDVLAWADGVLATYSDRRAIVVSHYIVDKEPPIPFAPQGQAIYDTLKVHSNLFLMLCGHRGGRGRREDSFDGTTVHSLLANFQGNLDGWLRILEFSPENDQVHVTTYSPTLDQFNSSSVNDFVLSYEMEGEEPFVEIGQVSDVTSGGTASLAWPGRKAGESYEWFVQVGDGTGQTTGAVWGFASDGSCAAPSECDDGDPCTSSDCVASFCQDVTDPLCCRFDPDCRDGDPCTVDTCVGNVCRNALNDCNDANSCTDDSCDPSSGCQNVANDANACDDGAACTDNDLCSAGDCIGGDTCPVDQTCDTSNGTCVVGDPLPVSTGENWRYFKGTVEPPADWATTAFDDSSWLIGPSGFGYGDGDDATILSDMEDSYLSVYVRHELNVSDDPATLIGLSLRIDYDDAFVAYLNGSEVARSANIPGSPPAHDRWASSSHEAGTPETFPLAAHVGLLVAGANVVAVQGHNTSLSSSDFSLIPEVVVTCDDGDPCTNDTWASGVGCMNVSVCDDGDPCTLDICQLPNCTHTPRVGFACDDGDLCTTGDTCDALLVCGGSPAGPPAEVEGVLVDGADPTAINWTDQGVGMDYDAATGLLSELALDGGADQATCLENDVPTNSLVDTMPMPPAADGYYYMIRSESSCGTGSYGLDSSATERLPTNACP